MAGCFSTGGASKLTLKSQIDFNGVGSVTDGDTKIIPFISASPDVSRTPIDDPSLTGNREEENFRLGGASSTFDLEVAHRFAQYDDFLEAALFGTWTANALEVSNVENPLCLWLEQPDISVDRMYENLSVNSMSLDAQLDSVVTLNFGMQGTSQKLQSPTDTTPVAQIATSVPYMHFDGAVSVNGTSIAYVQGISVDVQNNITSVGGWGSKESICQSAGRSVVTIDLTAQFKDNTFLTVLDAESEITFEFTLVDGVKSETWEFDRCRIVTDTIPVADGQLIQTIQLKCLRDVTNSQSAIKITRTA